MSDLWAYGRRPSCLIRYRHGGYNAIYPLAYGEEFEGIAATQRFERAAAEGHLDSMIVEAKPTPDNVLRFPGAAARRKPRDQASKSGRGLKRHPPPPKTRD
ncbi:MAG: hypothetical protein RIM72_08040 [Alphaproteobacteria bacterium]